MKPEIPFNPFKENTYFTGKNPEDMSLEELEILLYSRRLELRLGMDKLHKKINYSKIVIDILQGLGLTEKLSSFINNLSGGTTSSTEKSDTPNSDS